MSKTIDRRGLFGFLRRKEEPAPATILSIKIDSLKCTGCDLCTRVCPCDALRLESDSQSSFYMADSSACDGCGACLDICEAAALSLTQTTPAGAAAQRTDLATGCCARCRVGLHWPVARGAAPALCGVCATKPPAR